VLDAPALQNLPELRGVAPAFEKRANECFERIAVGPEPFAVAAFPTLSELAAQDKKEELIDNLSRTIRQILF